MDVIACTMPYQRSVLTQTLLHVNKNTTELTETVHDTMVILDDFCNNAKYLDFFAIYEAQFSLKISSKNITKTE